jgi:putative transposase
LQAIAVNRLKPVRHHPQHLCLDKGFDHDEPRALSQEFSFTRHLRTCSEEAKAKRWVVAPTHSWLSRFAPSRSAGPRTLPTPSPGFTLPAASSLGITPYWNRF